MTDTELVPRKPDRPPAGKPPLVDAATADELLAKAQAEGVELLGPDGLLSQVTKAVLERALDEEYGVAEGLLAVNPAAGVKAPRRTRADDRHVIVWEAADLLRFRAVADGDDWAAGWRLTVSGLRRSELLGMRWPAVDLAGGTVTVQAGRVLLDGKRTATDDPKSAASWRTVPVESMHPGTVALLRSLSARQATDRLAAGPAYHDSGYLLVDALGAPIRPEAYSDRFAELCKTADVPVVRLHERPTHPGADDAPGRAGAGRRGGAARAHGRRASGDVRASHRARRTDRGECSRAGARSGPLSPDAP
jgi:integrase